MELRHIRYFIAVAEEGSFSKAAKKLFISQPPLSRQIMNLEEELGVKLFDRTTRAVRLTRAGNSFLKRARNVIYESRGAATDARHSGQGFDETVSLGFMSAIMLGEIAPILAIVHNEIPTIDFKFRQMRSDEQLEAVIDNRIDIGFVDLGIPEMSARFKTEHISCQPFFADQLVVALPKFHHLGRKDSLTFNDLRNERFAILDRHLYPSHFDTVIAACTNNGFTPKLLHFADQIPEVLAYVAAGMAVSIAPSVSSKSWSTLVDFIPLKEKPMIYINMITKDSRQSPGIGLVRKAIQNVKGPFRKA